MTGSRLPALCVLTPDDAYEEDWRPGFARFTALIERAGFAVAPRIWWDAGELAGFDLVLPLYAWGYQRDAARWFAALDRWEAEAVPFANPLAMLRWNSDKSYLADLEWAGVPVVPTIFAEALDDTALAGARNRFGSSLVVKPPISGGADRTFRLGLDDPVPAEVASERMMIQPLLPGIADPGEYSLFYFGGVYSHAILKRPRKGDFRVQEQFGGSEIAVDPPRGAHVVGDAALAACPETPLYARADMVTDGAGVMRLMELELIEPSLWLHHAPDGGALFTDALKAALGS